MPSRGQARDGSGGRSGFRADSGRDRLKAGRVTFPLLCSGLLLLFLAIPPRSASALTLAAWNLEHLNAASHVGCVPRQDADYEAIRTHIARLGPDLVAVQEVENKTAAARVFPAADWQVVLSSRPEVGQRAPCRERPDKRLRHQATGFAIRTGVAFRRNPDLSSLANSNPDIPWGTDITILQGAGLRLLSVHLVSGCWGAEQDRDAERTAICETLRLQVGALKSWVEARQAENIPYAILGDFNRRLALDGDWAWRVLSSARLGLHLATAGLPTSCDPRYTALIDHIVVSGDLVSRIVPDSLREIPRLGDHPDHCAIMLRLRLGT